MASVRALRPAPPLVSNLSLPRPDPPQLAHRRQARKLFGRLWRAPGEEVGSTSQTRSRSVNRLCNFSSMLYSSLDAGSASANDPPADANSYRPFKVMNAVVTNNIQKELDLIEGLTEERVS